MCGETCGVNRVRLSGRFWHLLHGRGGQPHGGRRGQGAAAAAAADLRFNVCDLLSIDRAAKRPVVVEEWVSCTSALFTGSLLLAILEANLASEKLEENDAAAQ